MELISCQSFGDFLVYEYRKAGVSRTKGLIERLLAEDTGGTYYMEEKKVIKRGTIYFADLDPV